MKNAITYAKWFIDQGLDNPKNSYKGSMKLQKLLFFAQMLSIAKNNKLLFEDEFSAFEHGMCINGIRKAYINNSIPKIDNESFSDEELEILQMTKEIYGMEDADELSKMSHEFNFYKKHFVDSKKENGNWNVEKQLVKNEELFTDIDNMKNVLYAYNIIKERNDNIC